MCRNSKFSLHEANNEKVSRWNFWNIYEVSLAQYESEKFFEIKKRQISPAYKSINKHCSKILLLRENKHLNEVWMSILKILIFAKISKDATLKKAISLNMR